MVSCKNLSYNRKSEFWWYILKNKIQNLLGVLWALFITFSKYFVFTPHVLVHYSFYIESLIFRARKTNIIDRMQYFLSKFIKLFVLVFQIICNLSLTWYNRLHIEGWVLKIVCRVNLFKINTRYNHREGS